MNETPIVLACEDVTLGYEHKPLLEHLTLTVARETTSASSAKTAAANRRCCAHSSGFSRPSRARSTAPPSARADSDTLPQQTPTQRDFPATVTEVVLSGFSNRRARFFYTVEEKSAALMNLGKLGVLELKDKCYRELSGGQQQRVLLARALCAANDLLILDEPVTGLDPASMQDLYKTLRYLNEREGMAIIMVTHDIENALREAKHILCVDRAGCFYGTVDEFLSSPAGKRFGGERA